MKNRNVVQILQAEAVREGAGFLVHRPFPRYGMEQFDPFLLLDEMGPSTHAAGEAKGAPDHPHRGFETVTYLLSGEMEHRDSRGNSGLLRAGGVQWMTAGSGVIHSEMPSETFQRSGGTMHGFQIWVNLPRSEKMRTPRYQDLGPDALAFRELAPGARMKLIGGRVGDHEGAGRTLVPVTIAHFQLDAGATVNVPVSADHNVAVYVFGGSVSTGPAKAEHGAFVIFGEGDAIALTASEQGCEFLLLTGKPLREPVARYGPFVMNSRGEIQEALLDFEQGRFGAIDPEMIVARPS